MLVASVAKGAGSALSEEERADGWQRVAKEPQQGLIDDGNRKLSGHGPAELVDGRDVDFYRITGGDSGLGDCDFDFQVAFDLDVEPRLVELVPGHARCGEREVGELGAVDEPGDGIVALVQADDLVGQDAVGFPGQKCGARVR